MVGAGDHDEHRPDVISRNPKFKKSQFHVPGPGRPKVFTMGGLIAAPTGYETDYYKAVPFQMSPDYVGTPAPHSALRVA